jgi:hypothetical protein
MSDGTLATYDFVSFIRRGAAAALTAADPLSGALPYRGSIQVQLTVESGGADGSTSTDTKASTVQTYGPGDLVGIDPRHILRTDPRHLATNFEPNYLASIEFEHPDFPWLFTPAAPDADGKRLRPWLALIVLAEDEFKILPLSPPLPQISVNDAKTLPNLDESWAWAHAQIAGKTTDLAETVRKEPGRTISRLISPRRLRPRTRYRAFLVPTFAIGVLAGTGQTVPSAANTQTDPAWKAGDTDKVLPVYYQFEFATSERGDFESLARQLMPRVLPATLGIRPMSVPSQDAWAVPAAGVDLGLAGALRAVTSKDTPWSGPAKASLQSKLKEVVNRGAARLPDGPDDPRITPPMYGRWHAGVMALDPAGSGWLNELNLDPRTRAMAGLGTQVVRHQRGQLLTAAWRQLGAILEANQKLKAAQAARAAMRKVYEKHLQVADTDALLGLTTPVHQRLWASPQTIAATIARSRLPARALSPAFRRITRPLGPLRRRQGVDRGTNPRWVTRLNSGELRVVPPPRNPGGLTSLEDISDRFFPSWAPRWLRRLLPNAFWFVVLLVLLGLVALLCALISFAVGAITPAGAFVAAAIVLFVVALRLRALVARWRTAGGTRVDAFTSEAFEAAPPRPTFRIVPIDQPLPPADAPSRGGVDSDDARAFREAGVKLGRVFARVRADPPDPPPVNTADLQARLLEGVHPTKTISARIGSILQVSETLNWTPDDQLEPVMAAPVIDAPMYEPLRDLSQDLLLPGLKDVPANTVGLLEENHAFIEAYLLGANVEFGRELLYVDFPTDQRLSSFRQFWDIRGYVPKAGDPTEPEGLRERLRDIPPIHAWPKASGLGTNRNRPDLVPGNVVLLVRGQLLQRYPNAIVYATEARWDAAAEKRALGTLEKHPLFRGTLSPDLTFFGFDLTPEQARGSTDRTKAQGWWFVFQQQPTEPRLGLDAPPDPFSVPTVTEWDDLNWASFAADQAALDSLDFLPVMKVPAQLQIASGPDNPRDKDNRWYDGTTKSDAAQIAYITLRRPSRVAIHAEMMLPPGGA